MNIVFQNKYYNHPLLKLLKKQKCRYIENNGKYFIWMNYNKHNNLLYCLINNKINFIEKYNDFGIKEKNNIINERIIYYKNNKQYVYTENIKVMKIAELLNIKYLYIDNNAYLFYEEKKHIIIFFLFIREKVLNSSYTAKTKQLLFNYFMSSLQNFNKYHKYKYICNYFVLNMPIKIEKEYNKWKKNNNKDFSYKKDYDNRYKFIYLPQNKEFLQKEYEKINKLGLNLYNKYINSFDFKVFYNKTIQLIQNFEYEEKKIIKILTPENKKIVKKIVKDIEKNL